MRIRSARFLFPASTLLALILVALGVLAYFSFPATGPEMGLRITSPEDIPAAIPLPPDLKVEFSARAENYGVSSGQRPSFTQAVIDPRDVQVGEVQRLLVRVTDPDGVRSVVATTELDTTTLTLPLARIWGDENDGIWYGSWTVEDTHDAHYITNIAATNARRQTNTLELVWKDPHACDGALTGDWTVSASCSTSGVAGADAGNITVNSAVTLTVTAATTVAWNSGYSITVSGNLAIGGQIKQTNIWIKDADADLYAPNATDQLAQDTQPASYSRRSGASGVNDCYDANAHVRPNHDTVFGDWHTTGGGGTPAFDYNCDSAETKFYTGTGPSCGQSCCATGSDGSCNSYSYTANQPDNGSTIACGNAVTTYASAGCGSGGCSSSSATQACR